MKASARWLPWFFVLLSVCDPLRATEAAAPSGLPKGFVYVRDMIPDAVLEMRYSGVDNFVGRRVEGYEAPEAILSVEAAAALKAVERDLRARGYALKI
ncbi:MAG: hypothetical protein LBP86_04290, partial [Azoarcus sp.]|nr:hypothetical protein [Azoarcus sp.]